MTQTNILDANIQYANMRLHTDVQPFEIVNKKSDRLATVRALDCTQDEWKKDFRPNGFFGTVVNQTEQKWIITPNVNNPEIVIRLHKNGQWKDRNGNAYTLSEQPCKYYDFNF